jgi:hypothetical protein
MKYKNILGLFLILILCGCANKPDLTQLTKVPFPNLYCEVKFGKTMVINRRKTNKDNFARICAKDEGGEPCAPILLEAVEEVANSPTPNSQLDAVLSVRDNWCSYSL